MAETDPYGTDLALDPATGDLVVWPNGELGTLTEADNCIQAMTSRVRTRNGELPLHPEYGSGFPDLVGSKGAARLLGEANNVLREILADDRRFLSAQGVRLVEPEPGTAAITVYVALAGGERLQVVDLAAGQVEEIVAPEFADADALDLDQVLSDDDHDFLTQSEDELAELDDYNQVLDLLEPPTHEPED